MPYPMTRHFVRVRDREVHYRRAGSGPPFVLFHVSPQHSGFSVPPFLALADRFTVIGFDSPGFGESDPLPMTNPTAADYADATMEAIDALGIRRTCLYGAHTGAHIALELAVRHPGRVAMVVLDGLSINTPAEARERLDHYAPTFQPQKGGEHLAWAWQHTRDQGLFAPWYKYEQDRRLDADMHSAQQLHNVVLAKMNAANYWIGYRSAFGHDPRGVIRELTVPGVIIARAGDWRAETARKLPFPPTTRILETDHANEVARIGAALAEAKADPSVPPPPVPTHRPGLYRTYAARGTGQRLVRRGGAETGTPLVLLHDTMGGSRLLDVRMRALGTDRPVLAPDIAGNADSDALESNGESLAAYAADTLAVLDAQGVGHFDLYGEGLGAVLALAIAQAAPRQVGKLVLDRPILPPPAERAEMARALAPAMEARWDGTHFLTAWHMLRDNGMFWPWYRRTRAGIRWAPPEVDPVLLQQRLIEWLKGMATYGAFARAALNADTAALLAAQHPALVLVGGDLTAAYGEQAAKALPQAKLVVSGAAGDAPAIRRFLAG